MVYKRSEYGQQFKVSSLQKNIPVYKENLTYRYSRRERECAHTPIAWDDEVIEETDSDGKISPDERVDKLPISDMAIIDEDQESAEEDDEVAKEKKDALYKYREKQTCDTNEDDIEITKTEARSKQARAKLNKYVTKEIEYNLDKPAEVKEASEKKCLGKTFVKPKSAGENAFVKSSKPKRPDRMNKIPKSSQASTSTAKRPESRGGTKSPFVAYGCGDAELVVGKQKTFNVRASSAVHPAALRAKRRNLLAMERRQEKERAVSAREKKKKALFNERMARETVSWSSEYSRAFPAYENTLYVTTDRDPRRQKSFFTT